MSPAVVIPTRNEPLRPLYDLTYRANRYGQVFVVDDSDEGQKPAATFVVGNIKPGAGSLGGSILSGLHHAVRRGSRQVVVIDAGGSHDWRDIPRLLERPEDIAIGSRFCPGGHHDGPLWRSVGSRLASRGYSAVTGVPIHDWTSGLRCYSRRAVYRLLQTPPSATRHAWQVESLHILIRAGLSVTEVPITYRSSPSSLSGEAMVEAARLAGRLL